MKSRSWVEINLDTVAENYRIYKSLIGGGEIMAVVKANGYGHGAVRIAEALSRCGVARFAVATLNEAIELREGKIEGEILILGYTPPTLHKISEEYRLTQAITSEEYAEALIALGAKCDTHIAIDTGMRRIGLDGSEGAYCLEKIAEYSRALRITGAFTHLYGAISREDSERQLSLFDRLAPRLISLGITELHALNSLGGILYKRDYLSYTRCGILLYGLHPSERCAMPTGIRSPLCWYSEISRIGRLRRGEGIGYSHSFKATRDMTFAVISTGYADGYRRGLSRGGVAFIRGVRCAVIGDVCMDQFMVDISECQAARVGDIATLLSADYTADDMAAALCTIGYEVVTGIGGRVERIYKSDRQKGPLG